MKISILTVPFILMIFIYTTGCANPMESLESEIKFFKKEYPDNFSRVEFNNRKVHYAWSGDVTKRPIVFVHGSPGSWEGWARYLNSEQLKKQFHIIVVDRFGYGKSEKGKTEHSLLGQAEVIKAALQSNQSGKPAILVGHSYGGPVIASSAIHNPELSAGLLFIAGSVDPKLEKTKWIQYPATWWPIRLILPSFIRVCNEEIMSLKKELQQQDKLWNQVRAKVFVIQGLKDKLVPPENSEYLQRKLPKDLLISNRKIEDAGHFIIWQNPKLIIEAILEIEKNLQP